MSPAEIRRQALAEAELLYGPQSNEYKRQQAEELKRARQYADAVRGSSEAAAKLAAGIGPQIASIYGAAGRDQAAFAQGFTDGLRQTASQSAAEQNKILETMGAPAGQMLQGDQGAANVVYGLGGWIPATTFGREGAAFGAAAAGLPSTFLGAGLRGQRQALAEGETRARTWDERLAEIAGQKRGTVAKTIGEEKRYQQQLRAGAEKETYQQRQADLKMLRDAEKEKRAWALVYAREAKDQVSYDKWMSQATGYLWVKGKQTSQKTAGQLQFEAKETRMVNTAAGREATAQAKTATKEAGARKKAALNRGKAVSSAKKTARSLALSYSTPKKNPRYGKEPNLRSKTDDTKFKYLTPDNKPTNDPKKAGKEKGLGYTDTFERIYAQLDAAGLIARYGLVDKQIRSWIHTAMRQAGWKRKGG